MNYIYCGEYVGFAPRDGAAVSRKPQVGDYMALTTGSTGHWEAARNILDRHSAVRGKKHLLLIGSVVDSIASPPGSLWYRVVAAV